MLPSQRVSRALINHYDCLQFIAGPELIKRADVIITTYQTVVSEFKTWGTQGADHTATNAKSKAKDPESDEESDDSLIGKSIKKKAPAKKAPKSKAKPCFLFDLNFYRIVLGGLGQPTTFLYLPLTRDYVQTKLKTSRIVRPKRRRHVLPSMAGSVGYSQVLQSKYESLLPLISLSSSPCL